MVAIEIYAAAAAGAFFNVWAEDGYSLSIFWENGKLQMGVIMSFVLGILGALYAAQIGVLGATTALGAFAIAFVIPFSISTLVTKSPYGNTVATVSDGDGA